MEPLDSPIRPYAWGSHTAIAAIQGREIPSDGPEAELWMGAHPAAPSKLVRLDGTTSLADAIAEAPDRLLGPAVSFGRLPYLFKLLAADQPLSLQVHPDAAQAAAGYAAEEEGGIPADDPARNYADPYHKPEMICALTEFDALCGFRDPAVSASVLSRFDLEPLEPLVADLRSAGRAGGPEALRHAVTELLTLPADRAAELVDSAVATAARLAGRGGPDDPAGRSYTLAAELGERYPGDPGVLVALLLNQVRLQPGQAMFAPAGYPHAYLRGVGMEIMAASDNVLRGGLTPKHVDVPELLKLLNFRPGPPPLVDPVPAGPGVARYPSRVGEFELTRARVGGPNPAPVLASDGPRILFCLSGTVLADDGEHPVTLAPGHAAFVAAGHPEVRLTGFGEVFQATTGPA